MFVIPEGVRFSAQGDCCSSFDGFHEDVTVNNVDVPVAFVCGCNFGGTPQDTLDELSVTISHELAEAATDPFPFTSPAFSSVDDDHIAFNFMGGGEVGDMCENLRASHVQMPGVAHPFQRSWSNAAAAASSEPCVPALPGEVFVSALPVIDETVQLPDGQGGTFPTKALTLDVGETRDVDVQLFSDGPVDLFGVNVFDLNEFEGFGSPELALRLNSRSGKNGEILHLSVTVLQADPFGLEVFVLEANHDRATSLAVGMIVQPG
jgi:hypothetical protein